MSQRSNREDRLPEGWHTRHQTTRVLTFFYYYEFLTQILDRFKKLLIIAFVWYRWFRGFDWMGLRNKSIIPPIVPHVSIAT